MRLAVFSGEASGDAYAAALIPRIVASSPVPVTVEAIGGKRTAALDVSMIADSSPWGAVSITQAAMVAARAYVGLFRARAALRVGEPGLAILIDFGAMNVKVARFARRIGWKTLYFIPPGSWRRDRQGTDIPSISDVVVTPFPWSAEQLRQSGADARFYGHPLKQLVAEATRSEAPVRVGVAVLPGSRAHEIRENLPVIAGALKEMREVPAEFAVAPTVDADALVATWRRLAPDRNHDKFTSEDRFGVLTRAQAAIVCSGTATLEAALCRCPMVVIYRVSKTMVVEAKLLRFKVKFVALPNILLDRRVVPELLQHDATSGRIADEIESLIKPGAKRTAQLEAFDEIDGLLGPSDALDRTADLACEMLGHMSDTVPANE